MKEKAYNPSCPLCDGKGYIPTMSGSGDRCGGYAETCECQHNEKMQRTLDENRRYAAPTGGQIVPWLK